MTTAKRSDLAPLFFQARQGRFGSRTYTGPGGQLYSVTDTLLCIEREFAAGEVQQATRRDLLNLLAQRSDWDR